MIFAIGVVNLELKRYSICIPKSKGDKKGWTVMVEALRQLDISTDKKEQQEEVKALGRLRPDMVKGRSFADTVKGWWNKGSNNIRVEVEREELSRNLSRLEHCLIGSWSPRMQKGKIWKTWVGKWQRPRD